jgi:hypothetical protein
MGSLDAAQIVGVGFLSSQGEGARAFIKGFHENSHQDTRAPSFKKIKFLCVFVPLWQSFSSSARKKNKKKLKFYWNYIILIWLLNGENLSLELSPVTSNVKKNHPEVNDERMEIFFQEYSNYRLIF